MKLQKLTIRKVWLTALVLPLFLFSASCSADSNNGEPEEPAEPSTDGQTAEVFYVADNARGTGLVLFSELTPVEPSDDLAEEVIGDLIDGEMQPMDPDYSNLWDNSNELNDLTISGDVATIDIDLGKLNVGSEAEQRAIDQLVWTLTGIEPSIKTVRLLVNGKKVESLAGHVDATMDFTRAPDYEVLNSIQIHSPNEGEELSGPITISGEACTFEANVAWEFTKDGVVIEEGATTAEAACPDRSKWTVEVGAPDSGSTPACTLEPGVYVFSAREYSAEDGSLVSEDTKTINVICAN